MDQRSGDPHFEKIVACTIGYRILSDQTIIRRPDCHSAADKNRLGLMRTILFIILIVLLIGALPTWPYSSGWGYYPSGGLGLVLVILLIFALMGRV